MNLRGVSYKWRTNEFPENGFDEDEQYGLIAQEVEKEFPILVKTDENGDKAVNYNGMIPVLIETIKEQQKMIEELQSQMKQVLNQ